MGGSLEYVQMKLCAVIDIISRAFKIVTREALKNAIFIVNERVIS